MQRVVITGMGVVSCLGNDVETVWAGLIAGKSGLAPMSRWDPDRPAQPAHGRGEGFSLG